jgi:hypothetical protein
MAIIPAMREMQEKEQNGEETGRAMRKLKEAHAHLTSISKTGLNGG